MDEAANAAAADELQMDRWTLRLPDPQLEQRFWATWTLSMLVGDVANAAISAVCGVLILMDRLGYFSWDYVRGDLAFFVAAVIVIRLGNIVVVAAGWPY
jgi:hypothetical protein